MAGGVFFVLKGRMSGDRDIAASERRLQDAALEYATLRRRAQGDAASGMVLLSKEDARKLYRLIRRFRDRGSGWASINIRPRELDDFKSIPFEGLEEAEEDADDDAIVKLLLEG